MGGKKNKSKKFLRQKHNAKKKHSKQKKKKKADEHEHDMMENTKTNKNTIKTTKKAKELFNAGINALNEQPQVDVGLLYTRTDAYNPSHDDDDLDASLSGDPASDDWSDVISLQSEVTIIDDEILNLADCEHLIETDIDNLITDLNDKDSSIRIRALTKLNNDLRIRRLNEDDITSTSNKNNRLQLLSQYLAFRIRKGSVNEQLHALDALGVLALSLQDGLEFFIKYFQNMVKKLITLPQSAIVQVKAINIMAIMVWSYGEATNKLSSLKLFEYFWNYNLKEDNDGMDRIYKYGDESDDDDEEHKEPPQRASTEILTAAIDAWLFLITSIGSPSDIGSLLDAYCPSLLQLLRLDSTGVREKIHIGKALTVLIDNYNTALEDEADFEAQDVNLDAVMSEFNHLKSNSKQHRRREFAQQKTKFRDYLKTLEHKWTPIIVIKLHHKKFELSGWDQWIQYHFIKKILNNGLQAHLLQNERIKETFQIEIDAAPVTLSKHEKKNKKKANFDNERKIKQSRRQDRDKKRGFMFDKTLIE
eukprot:552673_1